MFIIISMVSAILAGMGIGGGAIFVLLATSFLGVGQKEAQTLNLVLFIATSISATISNLKNKKIDFKILKKTIIFLIIGSLWGTSIFRKLKETSLRRYFVYFLVLIGIYEIITSLISIKKDKNSNTEK